MITLSANRFLGALTNLIAYSQVANTTERGRVGDFVNSFQDINVENGDGDSRFFCNGSRKNERQN